MSPRRPSSHAAAEDLSARSQAAWRNPAQIASQWQDVQPPDPALLRYSATRKWWDILEASGKTLLVTREYEHLALALTVFEGKPLISFMQIPHVSGLAVDEKQGAVYVASTRNPNVIFDLAPVAGRLERRDVRHAPPPKEIAYRPLLPRRLRFYPGCSYMHDLALIGGRLHVNSVGQNAVVRLHEDGTFARAWWPRCIERKDGPAFDRNYIQLNSIAAGRDLRSSFFSASSDRLSSRRPGHQNYPVDRRGVIFSGRTREPVAFGLTRPHSARLYRGEIYVDNSGYGELSAVAGDGIQTVARLPGWTRGLAFHERIAFVGTSRVLPRFRQYAPGLDLDRSRCGLHAVDLDTGAVLASLYWPHGNQIFAIDLAPRSMTLGFPSHLGAGHSWEREKQLYYTFLFDSHLEDAANE